MPESWSKKDEKQYQHIRESEVSRGVSEDRAKEIAARTVNKQRSSEGRTHSGGAGDVGHKGGKR